MDQGFVLAWNFCRILLDEKKSGEKKQKKKKKKQTSQCKILRKGGRTEAGARGTCSATTAMGETGHGAFFSGWGPALFFRGFSQKKTVFSWAFAKCRWGPTRGLGWPRPPRGRQYGFPNFFGVGKGAFFTCPPFHGSGGDLFGKVLNGNKGNLGWLLGAGRKTGFCRAKRNPKTTQVCASDWAQNLIPNGPKYRKRQPPPILGRGLRKKTPIGI